MPNILVVDDEIGMREGCRRALMRHGYQVSTAEHGADGLRQIREGAFDLVLLDAMMPGLSGLEFLDRAAEHDPDLICVMITGYATVDLAAQAMKKGAHGFLSKPFTSEELLAAVRSGLEERARRLALREQREREDESRQMERMREEQAKLDAITSRFLLVVVHELRNPAGVIKNYLQLMRGGYVEADEWKAYLEQLDARASQLLNMLDDLLELAHLKEATSSLKGMPVAVAPILQELVQQFQPAAEAKGLALTLRLEAAPTVMAQPGHLRTLWRHLIDNAVCYTRSGHIEITLSERDGTLVSTVSDTGIGMSTEDLTRIFQEFHRTEEARAESPFGTGLGLPIVNQILRLYQGTIQVESTPGQGSAFTLSLPIAPSEAGAP